ncbi:MAG: response regulator [Proteobacteria bacterium]|nr:response regulator [Pseudomonadota bacterium]
MPELAREAFRAIAEYTYDWESWIGPLGETRWINAAVERMTGYSVAACLELPSYPLPLVHEEDRDTVREVLAGAAQGTSGNDLEFRISRRDGAPCWGAMSWQPLTGSEGRRLGYRTSVRNITERKRTEARLCVALARAERADRARAAFLASVSHELRTPLHGILGFAELLTRSTLAPQQAHWLGLLREQGQLLLHLVDHLLDVAARDAVRPPQPWERFDVAALVRRVVEAQRSRVVAKGLVLELQLADDLPPLISDRHAVEQILGNLLDNALKFTPQGSITIVASRAEDQPDELTLSVHDTGIGMPADRVADLRRPFSRGDDAAAQPQAGVGLGLAIVDHLLAQLAGRLAIETQPGRGSRFTVTLPTTGACAPPPTPRAPTEQTPSWSPRVLVVDDSAVSRELAEAFLERLGCSTETVGSARAAIARCRETAYDLVLLDRQLPDLDGASAAQLIRAQASAGQHPPRIVAMTAAVFLTHEQDATAFDDVLTKPVSFETLARCLRRHGQGEAPPADDLVALDESRLNELDQLRTAGGQSFWQRFGRQALEELQALAAEIDLMPPDGDATRLARLAHRAKGAAEIVGGVRLAARAAHAQALLEAPRATDAKPLAVELAREVRSLLNELVSRGWDGGPPAPGPGVRTLTGHCAAAEHALRPARKESP